ncbi:MULTISPECIES: transglycosylase domain-containing protein [unclassified Modestobacter]|uniref:transglycosylase domain-containing protein n=1 Tax=unclassified Modestobacter TaxID=2643866 RepID=UPI0022AAB55C|nr:MULTISPECIES: transglycosylase domain-containing protein [unclassified Modestobacter]MCZ2813536.1 transglycosylase domain-containing protein [Modestobacter sp. VKM Ac-2979]MCZ2842272.1 transglycosylase domain-containing protein [Modestobacter sp. VKM Ac-2980]MCZ2846693.1 transglycosylase domain-containing protein [Modestobacter sp. VKM Ac-2978]
MSDSARSPLGALVKLAVTIVVAGALVAAMLLPLVGGTGLVARNSASLLDALPVELTDETPNGNATMVAADGAPITQFYDNNRTPVTHDQISDVMKQAIVDIEDSRFYQHNGLDVEGTTRALAKNLAAGEVLEGGSTLTQQLVKQTLLQTADNAEERAAAEEESVGRKLKEARLALALEEEYSKDEILTRYLNIAYFGQGAYGIQSAAQKYFSVNAVDLTLPQASVLAGLVQSPKFDPIAYPAEATTRRDQVLNRMHQLEHISDQELAEVTAAPIPLAPGGNAPNGCIDAAIGGFFCDYVMSYLTGTLGLSPDDIKNNGWTIQTTLRPDMQVAGDQAVLNTVGMGDPVVGVYDAIEPGTGHVLAMSVNRRFGCGDPAAGCESVNFATIPTKGSGSTFKTFVAAAALEQGLPASHTITTSEPYTSRVYQDFDTDTGKYKPYSLGNVGNNYPNTLTMTQALYMSSNTYFLALEDALGRIEPAVRMAERLGMTFDYPVTQTPADKIIAENRPSFAFGTDGVSPLDLANAYATIAAGGVKCAPLPVLGITDRNGEPVTDEDGQPVVPGTQCEQVVEPGLANTMNQMMRKDVEPGNRMQTGANAYIPGHQIAGKTGTVNRNDSVTFVGSTPEYTATVMVFRPTGIESVGGYGGGKPATIWHDAMLPILSGQPTAEFPAADPKFAGRGVDAPPTSTRSSSNDRDDRDDRGDRRRNQTSSRSSADTVTESAPTTEAAPVTEPAAPADPAAPQPESNGG